MDNSPAPAANRPSARLVALSRFMPGLVLGIFIARVIGESAGLPGLWAAAGLSLVLGAAGAWLLARWPAGRTWPALILLAYVIYPEPLPAMAIRIAAVALAAFACKRFLFTGRAFISGRRAVWVMAGAVALVAFTLYHATLAPDVLPADSGELQVVAAQLGVAHPPGFPLYVMLSHIFTRLLGFLTPAYAVNLFSAVTGALTVGIVFLTAFALTRRPWSALLAAVALASAATFWSQSTTANVRSLTGLFASLVLFSLIRFRAAVTHKDRPAADRWLVLTALFMGFGLTHHVSLIFLIAVGLVFIAMVDTSILRAPRRWGWPLVAGLSGLLPLLYLPLRAAAGVRGASPDLATVPGFLEHVLATGFRGDLFYYLSLPDLWQRLLIMGNVLTFQFAPAVLAGMLVGLILLLRRDRSMAWLLGGTVIIYTLVAATYRAPQTIEYMLPAYVAAALVLACGAAWLPDTFDRLGRSGMAVAALFAALILVGAFGQANGNISASGRGHESTDAREFAELLLAEAPAGSVILAHWHWATPLWYLQEIEGARPDVDVRFVFPEGEDYDATWERRTRQEWQGGRSVITTWVPPAPLGDLPTPEPVGEALLFPLAPREALPDDFTPTDLTLGALVQVLGYRMEQPSDELLIPGDEMVVTVAWRPLASIVPDQGLFIHLVGADGVIYGQDDRLATATEEGITLTQFRITARPATPAGALSILIGASGGGAAGDRRELTSIEVGRSDIRPFTRNPVHRITGDAGDRVLVGYDWDHTLEGRDRLYLHWAGATGNDYWTQVIDDDAVAALFLPPYRGPWGVPKTAWDFPGGREGGHYVPLGMNIVWTGETLNGLTLSQGQSVVVDGEFHSTRPINRDYVVSLRLIGLEPDGIHWDWWDLQDSIPAMGAIPTLKWIDGSFVRSPHRVTVAEAATPGQELTGALALYDAFTRRPLPILDERMTAINPWIPLCRATVEH